MAMNVSHDSSERDPVTLPDDGHPLKPNEIRAIRYRHVGAECHEMDVPRLLEHITWLDDQVERARAERDTLRDRVGGAVTTAE